jgi:single-strand DNA-binding protein
MDLNRATLIGNVTRDPESRATPSGQTVCTFGIATNRQWKDKNTNEVKKQAEFHNMVVWGRLAETCQQYLKKGSRIYAEGRIQTRTWDDPTGQKKNRTEIVLENMIMLDKAGANRAGGAAPVASESNAADFPAPSTNSSEPEINVEEIPF